MNVIKEYLNPNFQIKRKKDNRTVNRLWEKLRFYGYSNYGF